MATWREEAHNSIKSQNDAFVNQTESNSNARNNLKAQMTTEENNFVSNFGWLKSHASTFKLHGSKVEVIQEPCEFHRKLKTLARNSKKRILLASLYLGTGSHEKDLVDSLEEALISSKSDSGDLKVTVILDHMRGSRGVTNSRSMLMPLIKKFFKPWSSSSSSSPTSQVQNDSDRTSMQLFLYHTPDLQGWLKQLLPERFNEVVGLFHIKAYIFDDNVIISGANLSESYFTDRQDRYILIKDFKPLADFYDRLLTTISKFSFLVQPDNSLHYFDEDHHPYLKESSNSEFRKKLRAEIEEAIRPQLRVDPTADDECDTVLHPLVQMGPVGVDQDRFLTELVLKKLPSGSHVFLASGYFNLTDEYMRIIIDQSQARFNILTAAPQANSFFESPGISKYIPVAYTQISKKFLEDVHGEKQEDRIAIHEYIRPEWTVHAKGLWIYPSEVHGEDSLPYVTMIGSPNYGYRSVKRDLESQVIIITTNDLLRRQLHQEKENIYKDSEFVSRGTFDTPERLVPRWLVWLTPHIKNFF